MVTTIMSEQGMQGSIYDVFKVENLLRQTFEVKSITCASIVGDAEVKAAAFSPCFKRSPFTSSNDP